MELPRASAQVPLIVLESAGSTNDELLERAAGAPDLLTVVTTDQRQGRGRMRRQWSTPPGRGLAASVLLRLRGRDGAPIDRARWGWVPLIAGAAMTRAIGSVLGDGAAALKWPNDVLVGGLKVSGILTEAIPDGDAVVVGAGVNLSASTEELPVPTATSLTREGASLAGDALADAVLAEWLTHLRRLRDAFSSADGSADRSGVHDEVLAVCATIGRRVEVHLPANRGFSGVATGLDGAGRLLVRRDAMHGSTQGVVEAVAAGDVVHLR